MSSRLPHRFTTNITSSSSRIGVPSLDGKNALTRAPGASRTPKYQAQGNGRSLVFMDIKVELRVLSYHQLGELPVQGEGRVLLREWCNTQDSSGTLLSPLQWIEHLRTIPCTNAQCRLTVRVFETDDAAARQQGSNLPATTLNPTGTILRNKGMVSKRMLFCFSCYKEITF